MNYRKSCKKKAGSFPPFFAKIAKK